MQNLIKNTIAYVQQELEHAESGHDWFHIERVWKLSKKIAEDQECNLLVVELGALLHDIADSKFHNGDEELGPKKAAEFLKAQQVTQEIISQVTHIIKNISFKNRNEAPLNKSIELQIVQDADRIDALGAIGIARTFNFGGYKNNPIHLPGEKPKLNQSKEEYKKSNGSSINHFYEKLLLLKDMMNTQKGKEIASKRHQYMEDFLKEFFSEWEAEK
ncbi:HD domain-containing protein [Elizabethkingia sp. JS20170427COW]|uniref:HD domain-containing protein n=1 Tax=Elizabethkingia sp. JS20170427COW TaxID=2583851 RepID=UPI0011100CCA|nr:HD domain-containing protein [Elizabethkingia sp. JS20170427COW]QCX52772.1 HD domain-containing protein [Elizabethkingia sp. JS20170427COW]